MLCWKSKAALFVLLLRTFSAAAFDYQDALGQKHSFDTPPSRIISIMPSVTETLFAVGAGSQVVAVTTYCVFPEEVKKLPKIGDLNLNFEQIVSLHPDLIIGDPVVVSKSIEKLRSLKLPVLAIRTQTVGEIPGTIRDLAKITGHEERGRKLAAEIEETMAKTRAETSKLSHPRVFLEVWDKPLMTVGSDAFLGELIEIAGGENVAAEIARAWAQISEEVVVKTDPEIVLLLTSKREHWLSKPQWQQVTAIKKKQVYELDRDLYSHPSPRILDALRQLRQMIQSKEAKS